MSKDNRITEKYIIRNATENDAIEIGELMYSTEDHPSEEWGDGNKEEHMERLLLMIKRESNRFSHQNINVLEVDGEFAGILLALEGKKIKKSTYKADVELYKMQTNFKNKLVFIMLAIGYLFDKECSREEFYISNIAIKPKFRGQGLSNKLMEYGYKMATEFGYEKVSLRANNKALVKFYEKLGFELVKRSESKMILNI